MPKTITLQQLKNLKACEDQVALFEQLFGNQVEVTPENCAIAYEAGINFHWAWVNCLSHVQQEVYTSTEVHLRNAYYDAKAPLWDTYLAAEVPRWATYEAAIAHHLGIYNIGVAQAFCTAYNS